MASRICDRLRTILPKPCFDRPLVCDGVPERCTVLIIGENPAVQLGVDWWAFWNDESGFDRHKFQLLLGERKPTKTRLALDRLLGPLRREGLGCLETNVFRNENP